MVMFWHLFKLLHVYLGCHIDSLANEWNYTVGDNHPVPFPGFALIWDTQQQSTTI